MARIRSVKPSLRTSEVVASWPFEVRYFWVLFWGYLDDEGRGLDVPKAIAGDCFPHDDKVTPAVISRWLDLMAKTKLDPDKVPPVCRYEVGGRHYVHAVNWGEHQRPNRPRPSVLPHCPVHEPFTESVSESRTDDGDGPSRRSHVLESDRGNLTAGESDRAVSEPPPKRPAVAPLGDEPPRTCPEHDGDPNPPRCGPCADARRQHGRWEAARNARLAAAPKCRQHRGQLAHNCALCRADQLVAIPPEGAP